MRASIKSIAKDLGISHMTVSRALSGHKHVSPATRHAVLEYARQTGYVRSSAAAALRGDSTAIVGLLLPNITNEFYAQFANAFGLLCRQAGFDLVIHLTNDSYGHEAKALQRLQALQARAIIRVPAPVEPGRPRAQLTGMRLINLIRSEETEPQAATLSLDDGPSIQAAVSHLIAAGAQSIAYIGVREDISSGRDRLRAFVNALRCNGLKPEHALIGTGAPGYMMGHDFMQHLLARSAKPNAVVCGGFEISNGALDACLTAGVRMPDDIAFVGYGDPSFYQWIQGGITTLSLSAREVARQAMAMLLETDQAGARMSRTVVAQLHYRASA